MTDHKLLKIIILLAAIIILVIGTILAILIYFPDEKADDKEKNEITVVTEVTRVKNRNDFFTVSSCVTRYLNYLTTKETDILYAYLDESYRKEKGITKENIPEYLKLSDEYYTFRAREMYVAKLSGEVSQYYVYGNLGIESTDEVDEKTDFYISIKIDKVNNTFSVIPDLWIQGLTVKE